MEMKVEIISRETIKPSSSTPSELQFFKLSFLDQLAPAHYTNVLLFYPNNVSNDHYIKATERSQRLKTSLSETLTRFYPLAGRIRDNDSIQCNDDGAYYVEANSNCHLSDILKQPDVKVLKQLLPINIKSIESATSSLVLIQASFFECRGMAIGVCVSHKIADAASLSIFIEAWVATAIDSSNPVLPEFVGSALFPPKQFSLTMPQQELKNKKCVRRLVFDASKIVALRAEATSEVVVKPTRVEAVTALIWKCATAASRSRFGLRLSTLSQSVNLRRRVSPPMSKVSMGNLSWYFTIQADESELELQGLVGKLRTGIKGFSENNVKRLQGDEALLVVFEAINQFKNGDTDFYSCSSWCSLPFYEADFGWGKPIWVTSNANSIYKNAALLMDTKDGDGIEVWLSLSEEDMILLENNEELLSFASFNPSVL